MKWLYIFLFIYFLHCYEAELCYNGEGQVNNYMRVTFSHSRAVCGNNGVITVHTVDEVAGANPQNPYVFYYFFCDMIFFFNFLIFFFIENNLVAH